MSDIHLLESNFNKANGSGTVKIAFHVPNDTQANNYPGGAISVVPGLDQAEIDGLNDGSLFEENIVFRGNINTGVAAIKAQIQGMWQDIADKVQTRLNEKINFMVRHWRKLRVSFLQADQLNKEVRICLL